MFCGALYLGGVFLFCFSDIYLDIWDLSVGNDTL